MKRRLKSLLLAAVLVACAPGTLLAQAEYAGYDARLEGYTGPVTLEVGTAMAWIALAVLAGACIAVMFKNPNRSHLD